MLSNDVELIRSEMDPESITRFTALSKEGPNAIGGRDLQNAHFEYMYLFIALTSQSQIQKFEQFPPPPSNLGMENGKL